MKPSKKKLDSKVVKVIMQSMGKAKELGWNPSATPQEQKDALSNPKFVYAKMGEVWGPGKKRGDKGNGGGFTVHWGAEKVGFGELTFWIKDGKVFCDTECMDALFVQQTMAHFLKTQVIYDPKN